MKAEMEGLELEDMGSEVEMETMGPQDMELEVEMRATAFRGTGLGEMGDIQGKEMGPGGMGAREMEFHETGLPLHKSLVSAL